NIQILIVDDDRDYALKLKKSLKEIGEVDMVHSEENFRKVFVPYRYDLILLDLRLKEGKEGLDLLSYIIEEDPSSVVIVISGYGDIATAVEALQKGAKTFLEKDRITPQEIRIRVEHALKESAAERRIRQLEASQETDEIIGDDQKIQKIRGLIKLVAQDGETTVQIRGETGAGKELVARAIHRVGVRKGWPFISVALTDMNPETITAELFGHEKGAFTGATVRHRGLFEQANRGVLFIDEIGDLPVDIQIKLLRVLDQKRFRRMGGREDIDIDVQVVTATNRPLEEMIKDGRFREDLYYRLKVFEIHLPPLRERRSDIQLLAKYLLNQLRGKGRTPARIFTDDAIELMLNYQWPGNVRELKSVVESVALRCRLEGSKKITKKHLVPLLMSQDMPSDESGRDVFKRLAEMELRMVEDALIHTGGKKTEAWKLLNYPNRFTMLRRVKRIMSEYPDIAEKFSEVKKRYGVME
ncbi:MAG: sigma-54-dependent transcriptional regulator, partial [Thermodesulfobacteriota bacterium]